MNILVTGANGYVGVHLLTRLIQKGHRVWALVRPGCDSRDVEILKSLGAAIVENDLEGGRGLDMEHGLIDVVIHLLGSVKAPASGTFQSVHEGKTRFLIRECKRLGVKKLVYLGTLGAADGARSEYLRTKWLAQKTVQESGLNYVIVRAPLIFGKTCGRRESKVIARLKHNILTRPRIPILGTGQNLLQPIFVGDLTDFLEKAAVSDAIHNEVIDVGGPERLSFEAIVDTLAKKLEVRKKKIKIPLGVAMILAWGMERLSADPAITTDQVRMMKTDTVCQPDKMRRFFGEPATRFGQGA